MIELIFNFNSYCEPTAQYIWFLLEFVVMISVVGVDNGSVQILLSVLVARYAVALLV
jgi:hypothetical protein